MFDLEYVYDQAYKVAMEGKKMAVEGAIAAKNKVTPGFIKRMKNKKIYEREVGLTEGDVRHLREDVVGAIDEEAAYFAKEKAKAERRRLKLEKEEYMHVEVKEALEHAKEEHVKADYSDYHHRRRLQLEEFQAKIDKEQAELAAKEARELKQLRDWRSVHFGKQAVELRNHAEFLKQETVMQQKLEYKRSIDRVYGEWDEREFARARMQVEAPTLYPPLQLPSGKSLAVFGAGNGKRNTTIAGMFDQGDNDGEYIDDLDYREHRVFSAQPQTEYEETNIMSQEISSTLLRNEQLYDTLSKESKNLQDSMVRMVEMRTAVERDLKQCDVEIGKADSDLLGPPRRLPFSHETVTANFQKDKRKALVERKEEIQHSLDLTDKRKHQLESQLLSLSKQIATGRDELKRTTDELESINGGRGMLPVVVGRSISKVVGIGGDPMAENRTLQLSLQPKETHSAVTQESKFYIMKEQSQLAMKTHKEVVHMDQNIWLHRQNQQETKLEAERTISRLANISEKIKGYQIDSSRKNLIDAISAFHASGMELVSKRLVYTGPLPWWQFRREELSSRLGVINSFADKGTLGGISFETEEEEEEEIDEMLTYGVSLGEAKSGTICGVIEFPKLALWSVSLTVMRKGNTERFASPDEQDHVVVHLGPTLSSTNIIGEYYNAINPETGAVLYDVKYVLHSKTLAFKFEFYSSVLTEDMHLAIPTGAYEEYEMKPLEVIEDKFSSNKGRRIDKPAIQRERVISSFVKRLRIEEAQGKLRLTKIIEELITVEDSKLKHWDSDILQKTPQRYGKDYFLKILRAEILLEHRNLKVQQAIMDKAAKSAAHSNNNNAAAALSTGSQVDSTEMGVGLDPAQQVKIQTSAARYLARRKEGQQHIIDKAMKEVGRRIDIYDETKKQWRHTIIKNAHVEWLENGTKVHINHVLQEVDLVNNYIGGPFTANLEKLRYFPSAQQDFDEAARNTFSNKLMWMAKLKELKAFVAKSVRQKREKYEGFNEREQELYEIGYDDAVDEFEENIDQRAAMQVKLKPVIRMIKQNVGSALLDMRKGIVKMDETMRPRQQAYLVAEGRYKEYWIEERRKELVADLEKKRLRMERRKQARVESLEAYKVQIRQDTAKEIARLEKHIEEQKQAEKLAIKAKVTWDPEVFKKAVPKAYNCEHLKTKAWGDNYATGIRCVICGKELTSLHEEESQILGYGSGASKELYLDVKRHREDEQSFRFKSAEQLATVEEERIRLEKERRELSMSENYFNDFQDLQAIYEFDQRHAKEIKAHGVFRQGLQWTETELDRYVDREVVLEKLRIQRAGLIEEDVMSTFDPFSMIENPPPTFRAEDERHLANYQELKYSMGRLHNFQRKIVQLKDQRAEFLNERSMFCEVLHSLHKGAFTFDTELTGLERDLDRTSKLLSTFEKMQKLWKHSNKILLQARRDLKRAEMRRCGVWGDVREANDQLSFIHDETKTLLKARLMFESRLDVIEKDVASRTNTLNHLDEKLKLDTSAASAFHACMPGLTITTRYGDALIRVYRERDHMVMCTLPFGEPPAKLWMHASAIIEQERARQQAETILMELEDEGTRSVTLKARAAEKRELLAMRRAEGNLKEFWKFEDLGKSEDSVLQTRVQVALNRGYDLMQTPLFQKNHAKNTETALKKFIDQRKKDHATYEGPPSGRPKLLSVYDVYKRRKMIAQELTERYLTQACQEADKKVQSELYNARADFLQTHSFESLIFDTVTVMIREIAEEGISEGRIAKISAEKHSALYIPQPAWMQYATYFNLTSIWKERKVALKMEIESNKGLATKGELSAKKQDVEEEEEEMKEKKRLRRIARREEKRQARLCAEMEEEEKKARLFWHWELLENLRERRKMKDEDKLSYILRTKPIETLNDILTAKKFQALKGPKETTEEPKKVLTAAQRRAELKEVAMTRRKMEYEQAQMSVEDEAGKQLRLIDQAERQKKEYIKEFGQFEEGDDDEGGGGGSAKYGKDGKKLTVIVPPWMRVLPDDWLDWNLAAQQKYIKIHTSIRAHAKRIRINAEKEHKRMDVYETRSFKEWSLKYATLNQTKLETELSSLNAYELLKEREAELLELRDNIRKIAIFCREKGEEELRARSDHKQKEILAKKRDLEVQDASDWLALCERRAKHRDKLKRRVTSDCKWVDTFAITGFHQRFRTELLRERLYWVYFSQIVFSIVNRAETIATERMLFGIQEKLSISKSALDDRIDNMKKLWRSMQRGELLRMRRSTLNETIFKKARQETLHNSFSSWVRFYYWNRGHREAFSMKYEVIRRRMQLDRQFKGQMTGLPAAPNKAGKDPRLGFGLTTIQKHKERVVQCKKCTLFYVEAQNTAISCEYHAGKYAMDCPRSCPNPGLTKQCQNHRKRRWTCCDSTKQQIPGCSRMYHVPVDTDPTYDKIMNKLNDRDKDFLDWIAGKTTEMAGSNWPREAYETNRGQINEIEEELERGKETAERYAQLKFV